MGSGHFAWQLHGASPGIPQRPQWLLVTLADNAAGSLLLQHMCLQDSNTLDAWATSSRPVWQPHAACKRRLVGSMASSNPWFIPFLTLNASTAYLVNLFNFQVTKHTSALTLQVLAFRSRVIAAS